MSSVSITQELRGGRRLRDRFGDRLLLIVTCGAGLGAVALIVFIGRALGEAIAVAQVIGAGWFIRSHLFATGDTLAARIALQYQGAVSKLQIASLFYLAAILLVIGLLTNLLAQVVVRRFAYQRTGGS